MPGTVLGAEDSAVLWMGEFYFYEAIAHILRHGRGRGWTLQGIST